MTNDDAQSLGQQVRRRVLGDAYVDTTSQAHDVMLEAFTEFGVEHIWGGVWPRPGLALKERSLITIITLAAMGRLRYLHIHLQGALNVGWTSDELREAFLHMAAYAGFPAASDALVVLGDVVREREAAR